MIKAVDFWLKMGVDGFRIAFSSFLFEEEEQIVRTFRQTT